jgi:hypothetical protein
LSSAQVSIVRTLSLQTALGQIRVPVWSKSTSLGCERIGTLAV